MTPRMAIAAAGTVALVSLAWTACARDGVAQSATGERSTPSDAAQVARLLAVARSAGADPLLCDLLVRHVDMRGSWSRWGSVGDRALVIDSAAAATLRWMQGQQSDPGVVPTLQSAMRDENRCVRRTGASFLARVEHAAATEALLSGLRDPRAEVREVAAIGLGLAERGAGEGVDALLRTLGDGEPSVRRASAWALGALEAKGATPSLARVLSADRDAGVRQAAAWAIGRIE